MIRWRPLQTISARIILDSRDAADFGGLWPVSQSRAWLSDLRRSNFEQKFTRVQSPQNYVLYNGPQTSIEHQLMLKATVTFHCQ